MYSISNVVIQYILLFIINCVTVLENSYRRDNTMEKTFELNAGYDRVAGVFYFIRGIVTYGLNAGI